MKSNYLLYVFFLFGIISCNQPKEKVENTEFIPVKIIQLEKSNTNNEIVATGLVSTENETKLSFKVGGIIDRIFVKEGQSIKKGQLLATLKLDEIDAQVTQAKLGFDKSKRDYTRAFNLYKDSVTTLEQVQNTKTVLEIAEKTLEQANFNRKYAYIYANSSGFVTKKIANEGEVIQSGFPVLAINELNNQKEWIVRIGISESNWIMTKENNDCLIAINNKKYAGKITQKSRAIDGISGTFQIEVKILNPDDDLAVGMFARVFINTFNTKDIITIPYDAVVEADGKNAFVFVPNSDSSVKKVPIEIENFNDDEVEVAKGLENIKEIIVGNSPFLNRNSKIKIIK